MEQHESNHWVPIDGNNQNLSQRPSRATDLGFETRKSELQYVTSSESFCGLTQKISLYVS